MRRRSSEAVDSMLNQFLERIQDKLGGVQVYLFGSHSKGDWMEHSDIDLIVVSDRFRSLDVGERARLVRSLAPDQMSFDLILYTYEEFDRAKESLSMKEIIDSCVRMV